MPTLQDSTRCPQQGGKQVVWPFKRKEDPNNPCKWGHNYERNKYIDENGITWNERKCTKCGDIEYKHGVKTIQKDYPIYMCTAPFGVLFNKLSGEITGTFNGVLTFNNGSLTGSINTQLEEKYIVKYLDGNQLKSKTFDAKTAPIFIGGKQLILQVELQESYHPELHHTDNPEYQSDRYWSIHIPELPDVEALTKTFLSLSDKEEKG